MASLTENQGSVFGDVFTNFDIEFIGINKETFLKDLTFREIILSESILTPGLQTSIKMHSYIHSLPIKFWDDFKGKTANIKIERKILGDPDYGQTYPTILDISQTVYRLGGRSSVKVNSTDDRKQLTRAVEELTLHLCDPTLLNDAGSLVSNNWKCTTPDVVVRDVLTNCVKATKQNIEAAQPARDYTADNIHPFQVVAQQASVALADGNDPSFVHFMTYPDARNDRGVGVHHFRSLHNMTRQSPIIKLVYTNAGYTYSIHNAIMHYTFPCDFDLLSDILNGIGPKGDMINSVVIFNPVTKLFSLFGNQNLECGFGGGAFKIASSNLGSEKAQNACPDYSQLYVQKRQARMALLEKDKVALRVVVPWNPIYNVGKVIEIALINEESDKEQLLNYGSGTYLITALIHNIKQGGYSTITIDCVSTTTGKGEV